MAAAANQQPLRHEQGDDGADEGEVKSGSPTDSIFDVAAGLDRKVFKERVRPDELTMASGLLNVILTAFIIGRWPEHFWLLHLLKMAVLLPWRYIRFRRFGWEWYLVEFCYFVSYYTLAGCFIALLRTQFGFVSVLAPYNNILVKIGFAFTSGPLSWSILIFKNSIVLHDIDQMTSVFIHLSPALVFWCLRWGGGFGPSRIETGWPGMFDICGHDSDKLQLADECITQLWCTTCPATWWELVVLPQVFYVCAWAVPYYLLVFVIFADDIKRKGKETLFVLMVGDEKSAMSKVVRRFPKSLQPVGYILVHQLSVLIFSTLSYLWWHSFWLHTIFLVSMVAISAWNGATYTFERFLSNYTTNLIKKHPSMLKDATGKSK